MEQISKQYIQCPKQMECTRRSTVPAVHKKTLKDGQVLVVLEIFIEHKCKARPFFFPRPATKYYVIDRLVFILN